MIVVCAMVTSPNGYIAKLDGDEEWISAVNWTDFLLEAKKTNNIVVGRETYELVMKMYEGYNFDNVECDHKVIVTTKRDFKAPGNYVVVYSPKEALDYLASQGVERALLAGGGKLNAAFAAAGLVDELELVIEPYVVGQGRPVLAPGNYEFPLELRNVKRLSDGRVMLRYKVGSI